MKLTIEQQHLVGLIDRVSMAVERSVTLPILSNVLLDARDGHIAVIGTNLQHQLIERTDAFIEIEGAVTVNAKKLRDIVKSLPSGSDVHLSLDAETERLILKSGRSRFVLAVLPAQDYPTITLEPENLRFSINLETDVLAKALNHVSFAAAKTDVRYYLNGVLFDFVTHSADECALKLCATDGHRLAFTHVDCIPNNEVGSPAQYILPITTIAILERLLAKQKGVTQLRFYSNGVLVLVDDTQLISKFTDGKYPDYQRVIPTDLQHGESLLCSELLETLNRVVVLSNDKYKGARLTFNSQLLTVDASNQEREEAQEEIELVQPSMLAETLKDDSVTVGLSISYLSDVLAHLDVRYCNFSFSDGNGPVKITDGTDNTTYVIMPMRL